MTTKVVDIDAKLPAVSVPKTYGKKTYAGNRPVVLDHRSPAYKALNEMANAYGDDAKWFREHKMYHEAGLRMVLDHKLTSLYRSSPDPMKALLEYQKELAFQYAEVASIIEAVQTAVDEGEKKK